MAISLKVEFKCDATDEQRRAVQSGIWWGINGARKFFPIKELRVFVNVRPSDLDWKAGGVSLDPRTIIVVINSAEFFKSKNRSVRLTSACIVLHEIHHCVRSQRQPLKDTLGQAIVSEGAANRFVKQVVSAAWPSSASARELRQFIAIARSELRRPFNYDDWFGFATRGFYPDNIGYDLSDALVSSYLRSRNLLASDIVHYPADKILKPWLAREFDIFESYRPEPKRNRPKGRVSKP